MPRLRVPLTFSPTLRLDQGSMQLLAQNEKRASLIIQNLAPSTATTSILYFSFGSDASANNGVALGPGRGVIIDVICPTSALFLFMNDATGQPLTVVETSWL